MSPICKVWKCWAMGLTPVVGQEPHSVYDDHVVICQGLRGGVEVAVQAAIRFRAAVIADTDHTHRLGHLPRCLGPSTPWPSCRDKPGSPGPGLGPSSWRCTRTVQRCSPWFLLETYGKSLDTLPKEVYAFILP